VGEGAALEMRHYRRQCTSDCRRSHGGGEARYARHGVQVLNRAYDPSVEGGVCGCAVKRVQRASTRIEGKGETKEGGEGRVKQRRRVQHNGVGSLYARGAARCRSGGGTMRQWCGATEGEWEYGCHGVW
jgi:hypothetical protein